MYVEYVDRPILPRRDDTQEGVGCSKLASSILPKERAPDLSIIALSASLLSFLDCDPAPRSILQVPWALWDVSIFIIALCGARSCWPCTLVRTLRARGCDAWRQRMYCSSCVSLAWLPLPCLPPARLTRCLPSCPRLLPRARPWPAPVV